MLYALWQKDPEASYVFLTCRTPPSHSHLPRTCIFPCTSPDVLLGRIFHVSSECISCLRTVCICKLEVVCREMCRAIICGRCVMTCGKRLEIVSTEDT